MSFGFGDRRKARFWDPLAHKDCELHCVVDPPPEESVVDRVTTWYLGRRWPAWIIVLIAIAAVSLGFLIVATSGCAEISGCIPGEMRCHNGSVEACVSVTGWEYRETCNAPELCRYDDPSKCSSFGIACCG